MNFRSKSISAFFWATSQQILILVLNLTISILLARILDPIEFGLIGMITIFIALGKVLMNGGLAASIIRTQNPTKSELSTVFYSNLIFSLLIFGVLYILAPIIASFFQRDELIPIVRVYSFVVIIFALNSIQFTLLTKQLAFKRTLKVKIPSITAGGITGIILAINDFGVWSLVGMYLMHALTDMLQLWMRSSWRPIWVFSLIDFRKHIGFGTKITGTNILNSFFQNIYNVVIGKIFTAEILGFFTRSQSLANLPVFNLQEILDKVTFPLLSTIQDDDNKMRVTFQKILMIVSLILLPIMITAIILSEPLFRFFLTEKWLPAVPYFQLICVAGIFIPLGKNNLNILKVKGRSGLMLKLSLVEKVIITLGLFLLVPFGIKGLLLFQVGAFLFSFLCNAYFAGNLIEYGLKHQLMDFGKVFLIAFAVGLATNFLVELVLYKLSDFLVIVIGVLFYAILYFVIIRLLLKSVMIDLTSILTKREVPL